MTRRLGARRWSSSRVEPPRARLSTLAGQSGGDRSSHQSRRDDADPGWLGHPERSKPGRHGQTHGHQERDQVSRHRDRRPVAWGDVAFSSGRCRPPATSLGHVDESDDHRHDEYFRKADHDSLRPSGGVNATPYHRAGRSVVGNQSGLSDRAARVEDALHQLTDLRFVDKRRQNEALQSHDRFAVIGFPMLATDPASARRTSSRPLDRARA